MGLAHSQSSSPAWLLDVTPNQCPSVTVKGIRLQKCVLKKKDASGFPEARDTTGAATGGRRNKIGFEQSTDLEFLEIQLLCCEPSPFLVSVFCRGSTDWLTALTSSQKGRCSSVCTTGYL